MNTTALAVIPPSRIKRRGSERARGSFGGQGRAMSSPSLSRDSLNDQRIDSSLPVQGSHGCLDYAVEGVGISEGLMGQMACFEIVPDNLDVVEFGCVF